MKKKTIAFAGIIFIVSASIVSGYLYITKRNYSRITITIGSADTPLTKVEIQGREFLLEVDSGSKFQLTLNKDILNNLEKNPCGTLQGRDAKGNSYDSPAYLVKKIKIGNHVFNDVVVKEVNDDYVSNTTLFINKTKNISSGRFGTVGRALLEKMNLFFDFQNFVILESNDIMNLKEAGYQLENLVAVPFEMGRTGAILTVDTDLGKTRLSLDTGSTVSLIRSSLLQNNEPEKREYGLPCYNTSKFMIGNKDFGNMDLYLFDITSELHEIDGILGMDFLRNHIFYINYQDKVIYIGDSTSQTTAPDRI